LENEDLFTATPFPSEKVRKTFEPHLLESIPERRSEGQGFSILVSHNQEEA
jgi:hypothetical protein